MEMLLIKLEKDKYPAIRTNLRPNTTGYYEWQIASWHETSFQTKTW